MALPELKNVPDTSKTTSQVKLLSNPSGNSNSLMPSRIFFLKLVKRNFPFSNPDKCSQIEPVILNLAAHLYAHWFKIIFLSETG